MPNHPLSYSVLMSVYQKENPDYLRKSIESMVEQTYKTDDFVLVCDGPLTDALNAVVDEAQKSLGPVLSVVRLETNVGLGRALSIGLATCKNELVARMDSDDIALPTRCEKQVAYMEANPDCDILGFQIDEYDDKMERCIYRRTVPTSHEQIAAYAKKRNPFNHMTVMYKKSSVLAAGNYMDCPLFEDYFLWCRMLQNGCRVANLDEVLLKMRGGEGMYRRRGGRGYNRCIVHFQDELLQMGFITKKEHRRNKFIRLTVSSMPNFLRKYFYEKKLRGTK
jgi:glycosyltransferase involved in cell wall biosynthesis